MTSTSSTSTAVPLAPGHWELDPDHSAVTFSIRHLGVSKVRGRFAAFDADVYVGEDLSSSVVTARIDVSSLDTGNAERDAHVLGPDILDVAMRPTMIYRSISITGSGDGYLVEGELTIGEVTVAVPLDLALGGVEEFFDGRRHAGFEATTRIRRKDFGIDPAIPPGLLGDAVDIGLDLQLVEPQTVSAARR